LVLKKSTTVNILEIFCAVSGIMMQLGINQHASDLLTDVSL
jgi:hypothetical protein